MHAPVKILALGTAAAAAFLSLCGVATSQTTGSPAASNSYLNEQVQLGDVVAGQRLDVQSADNGTSSAVTAIGNSASATGSNAPLDFESTQTLSGSVSALNQPSVAGNSGPYMVTTTSATGNSATAATCCATTSGTSTQTITGPAVGAESDVNLGGYASTVSADTTAVGNTQGWTTSNGAVAATSSQSNLAGTSAATSASVGSADTASYSATAVGNDVETNATNSPVSPLTVTQDQEGTVQALVSANQGQGGDVVATSSAVANNDNVYADSYGDSVTSDQTNGAGVNATTSATVGSWTGSAVSTAYGVGNSTVVSNAGSYTGVDSTQNNTGAITVNASLFNGSGGGAGGDAYVNAAGVGNAISAYACATCNGTISARNHQTNSGAVRVAGTITAGAVNSATGVTSAVGNTANYDVVSSSN